MAQRIRHDEPGAWLHVYNRGLARRSVFETREDCRYFLAQLARAVRAGWFEIHAYAILTTHFHLLVRSLRGKVWRGLRRGQNGYVRRFNRGRRRDGPLFRGRFGSRRIWSERHWWNTFRYIDYNAVGAGLVADPARFPWCSAHHYARRRQPPWLATHAVWDYVSPDDGTRDATRYRAAFGPPLTEIERSLMDDRLSGAEDSGDPLDDLIEAAPERVREWMERKARLADGRRPTSAIATAETVIRVVREAREARGDDALALQSTSRDAWDVMLAALLRELVALTPREIGMRTGCAESTAFARVRSHAASLRVGESDYADTAAACAARALATDWARRGHRAMNITGLGT